MTKEADGTLTLTLESGEKLGGFDQVLIATGREPLLGKLGLENAGVETARGYITVRYLVKGGRRCDSEQFTCMID